MKEAKKVVRTKIAQNGDSLGGGVAYRSRMVCSGRLGKDILELGLS